MDTSTFGEMITIVNSSTERSIKESGLVESNYRHFNNQAFMVLRTVNENLGSVSKTHHLSILRLTKAGKCECNSYVDTSSGPSDQKDVKFHEKWSFILSMIKNKDLASILGVVFDEYGHVVGFHDDVYAAILQQEASEGEKTNASARWSHGDIEVKHIQNENSIDADEPLWKTHSRISPKIKARLLNVVSMLVLLMGDEQGAIACLRASIAFDDTLMDTCVKLSSILCQGDETERSNYYISKVHSAHKHDPIFLMHKAEIMIKENDFDNAIFSLKKALKESDLFIAAAEEKNCSSSRPVSPLCMYRVCPFINEVKLPSSITKRAVEEWIEYRKMEYQWKLNCNLRCLLATAMFKGNPENPVLALDGLISSSNLCFKSVQLHVTNGEIRSQLGDIEMALNVFKKAHILDRCNPLPLLGAARAYLQMKQMQNAYMHVEQAVKMDPLFTSSFLDMSQVLTTYRHLNAAIETLEKALNLAQPFVEIRDTMMTIELTLAQKRSHEKLTGKA